MKLSKKGRDRLYGSHNVFYDADIEGDVVALYELSEVWEFEPDDFEDSVVLSIEEARLAMECAQLAYMFASSYRRPEAEADKELANKLAERIAQVEKHNETE